MLNSGIHKTLIIIKTYSRLMSKYTITYNISYFAENLPDVFGSRFSVQ